MHRHSARSRPRSERILVISCVLLSCLTLAHAIYLGYGAYFADITSNHAGLTQQQYYSLHNTIALTADHPLFRGADHAPDQYRIGVAYLGKFIGDRIGIAKYYIVFTVIDFFCAVAVCLLWYGVLTRSELFQRQADAQRTQAVLLLLVGFAYPLAWVVPWQRPETLPGALYLATAIALLGLLRQSVWWLAAIAGLTLWQGFVRADIALTLGIALLVLGCTAAGPLQFGSRRLCLGAAAVISAIAVAVQAYLKLVRYPYASYPPDTQVIQFLFNFGARQLIAFTIAMLPWGIIVGLAMRYRRLLDPLDGLAVVASCLYLPLWWTAGIISEVRLFVPFLLALTPTAAKVVMLFLQGAVSSSLEPAA